MSNWTHVAGVIRIDDIRLTDYDPDFDKLIGRECLYESKSSVWDELEWSPEEFLPSGSEGTLQKSVWINPDKEHMDAYTITIFGDLRDHDDPKEIITWFKNKCKQIGFIRNAVIVVENERNGTETYTYRSDEI